MQRKPTVMALKIQTLLDAGHSRNKIASRLKIHHQVVERTIRLFNLEIYTPFDTDISRDEQTHSDWEAEDFLESITDRAYNDYYVSISQVGLKVVSVYLRSEYGNFHKYLVNKGMEDVACFIYKNCIICREEMSLLEYAFRPDTLSGYESRCVKCNKERCRTWFESNPIKAKESTMKASHKRRAIRKLLPASTEGYVSQTKCELTGVSEPLHVDHFIPLEWGHGGTYAGNATTLRDNLNLSKSDSNVFEWFETVKQRYGLRSARLAAIVSRLAEQNGLTPSEFRQYVDWCYANKRNIDEIQADNERYGYVVSSLELWRDATGLPFPIRLDLPKDPPKPIRKRNRRRKRKESAA